MPVVLETGTGEQFVDATTEEGETVLIEELASGDFGRFGWTILRFGGVC
ncbi:hypothetical protein [Natrinema ejinorense]|nr:hypothetical protein [Natrinema ejinorense]